MEKGRKYEDRRPGLEVLRAMLDAPMDDPVCSVDGMESPAEAVADIVSRECPPGHETGALCYDRQELGQNTCRDCWLNWLMEGE